MIIWLQKSYSCKKTDALFSNFLTGLAFYLVGLVVVPSILLCVNRNAYLLVILSQKIFEFLLYIAAGKFTLDKTAALYVDCGIKAFFLKKSSFYSIWTFWKHQYIKSKLFSGKQHLETNSRIFLNFWEETHFFQRDGAEQTF